MRTITLELKFKKDDQSTYIVVGYRLKSKNKFIRYLELFADDWLGCGVDYYDYKSGKYLIN
jgi:hypothetical protein